MSSLKEQYIEEGYAVVKDVLNPEQDIYPLQKAYSALLDALARIYLTDVTHLLNNGVYSKDVEPRLGFVIPMTLENYVGRFKIWTKNS